MSLSSAPCHAADNGFNPEWDDVFEFKMQRKEFDILCFKVCQRSTGSGLVSGGAGTLLSIRRLGI